MLKNERHKSGWSQAQASASGKMLTRSCHGHPCSFKSRPWLLPSPGYSRGAATAAVLSEQADIAPVAEAAHAPMLPMQGGLSVFRLQCVKDRPRFDMPLLLGSLFSTSRSAFACNYEGKRYLVTTASAVSYCTKVEVFKPGNAEPFRAQVDHISPECELAVLSIVDRDLEADSRSAPVPSSRAGPSRRLRAGRGLRGSAVSASGADADEVDEEEEEEDEEERFWSGVSPLELGKMPSLQQRVQVLLPHEDSERQDQQDQDRQDTQSSPGLLAAALVVSDASGSTVKPPAAVSEEHQVAASNSVQVPGGMGDGAGSTLASLSQPGTIKSIEVTPYPSTMVALLALIVSAKVPSSSLGAPLVVAGGVCVGVVMKRSAAGKKKRGGGAGGGRAGGRRGRGLRVGQTGGVPDDDRVVAVSTPLLLRFLADVAAIDPRRVRSIPGFGMQFKTLAAVDIRRALGMQEGEQGILILAINPWSGAGSVLRPGDVLMQVDGLSVGNDGMLAFRGNERMPCTAYVAKFQPGEQLEVVLLREGQHLQLSIRLDTPPRLLPTHLPTVGGVCSRPQYLVLGGLVFTRCSLPYLKDAFGPQWPRLSPVKLLDKLTEYPKCPEEELVVIAECQPLASLDGYQAGVIQHGRILCLNGTPVTSLRQMAKQVFESQEEFFRLELEGGSVLVLLADQARADTKLLLQQYRVKLPVSEDLSDLLPTASLPLKTSRATSRRGART